MAQYGLVRYLNPVQFLSRTLPAAEWLSETSPFAKTICVVDLVRRDKQFAELIWKAFPKSFCNHQYGCGLDIFRSRNSINRNGHFCFYHHKKYLGRLWTNWVASWHQSIQNWFKSIALLTQKDPWWLLTYVRKVIYVFAESLRRFTRSTKMLILWIPRHILRSRIRYTLRI